MQTKWMSAIMSLSELYLETCLCIKGLASKYLGTCALVYLRWKVLLYLGWHEPDTLKCNKRFKMKINFTICIDL